MAQYAAATIHNTPAQILYQQWKRALDDYYLAPVKGSGISYGTSRDTGIYVNSIDSAGDPVLSFGWVFNGHASGLGMLTINKDGEFSLGLSFHGWKSRCILARETFLGWEWNWGSYHWLYDPSDEDTTRYRTSALTDLTARREYISARILPGWDYRRNGYVWLRLEPSTEDAFGWKIAFVRDENTGKPPSRRFTKVDFDKFEALRVKRYRRMARASLIEQGLLDPKGRTIKSEDELRKERLEAAAALGAHFKVDVPARTTSLRKK